MSGNCCYVVLFLSVAAHGFFTFSRNRICVHTGGEIIDCGVLIFLWMTRVITYD
jgi:hypothetical protein